MSSQPGYLFLVTVMVRYSVTPCPFLPNAPYTITERALSAVDAAFQVNLRYRKSHGYEDIVTNVELAA